MEPSIDGWVQPINRKKICNSSGNKKAKIPQKSAFTTGWKGGIVQNSNADKVCQNSKRQMFGLLNCYDHSISIGPIEWNNNKTLQKQTYGFEDM